MKKSTIAALSALGAYGSSASAALPESVTTAITTAGTDAATLGGAVLVVIVGIVAFKYLRRVL